MDVRRGDIWFIDCKDSTGSEQHGVRPAVIVSNDVGNLHSPIVEVVWLTTAKKKELPTHVSINGYGTALCEQIHTVDKSRLLGFKRELSKKDILRINNALLISLGITAKV